MYSVAWMYEYVRESNAAGFLISRLPGTAKKLVQSGLEIVKETWG